ncbi:MAG: MFS transporter [Hyphomicrobiales bacterium]
MSSLRSLVPLLAAAAILLAGNGLIGTAIALRASEEGFQPVTVGLLGAAYFGGFVVSCFYAAKLIGAVGHIRVFAALSAISAASVLCLILVIDPVAWTISRFVMGFCFAGLFMVVESWINASVQNEDRGRVLSIYRIVDLGAVVSTQFLLPVFGTSGYELFVVIAMMLCLSMVPISLSDRSRPKPPEQVKMDLAAVWAISPLACIGSFTIGLTNSAFRLVGPLYAHDMGLNVTEVAIFMAAGIAGGAALQYPMGYLSDRLDRRLVLLIVTIGAALAGLFLSNVAGENPTLIYAGIFAFGAFALPLFSLSAAHANDRAKRSQYVLVSAGMMLFFAIGASIGPLIASWVIERFGASAFFTYTSIVHASLIIPLIWRTIVNPRVIGRTRYVALLRTSPAIFQMAGKPEKRGQT